MSAGHELRLAGVGQTDHGDLPRPLLLDEHGGRGASLPSSRSTGSAWQSAPAARPEVVGALVLGHDRQHLFQRHDFFFGGLGGAEGLSASIYCGGRLAGMAIIETP